MKIKPVILSIAAVFAAVSPSAVAAEQSYVWPGLGMVVGGVAWAVGDDDDSDHDGPCSNPNDIAGDGTRCGDRAASVREGGNDGDFNTRRAGQILFGASALWAAVVYVSDSNITNSGFSILPQNDGILLRKEFRF